MSLLLWNCRNGVVCDKAQFIVKHGIGRPLVKLNQQG